MKNIEIRVDGILQDDRSKVFQLTAEHGSATVFVDDVESYLSVKRIDVLREHRRKGIGKALLRQALVLAEEMDLDTVVAGINSRESIKMFQGVFGEDSVIVNYPGTFTQDNEEDVSNASARLCYEIPTSTTSTRLRNS